MKCVLLVEDEEQVARVIEAGLERTITLRIEVRTSLRDAGVFLATNEVAAIVTDLHLPDCKGVKTVKELQKMAPDVPIIVLTGAGDGITYTQAIQAGAHDYLEKGNLSFSELSRCVLHAIVRHKVRKTFTPLEKELADVQQNISDLRGLVQNANG